MNGSNDDSDAISRQMQRVRLDLLEDVYGLVDQARTLTDWRHYWKKYPWACLGAAAIMGYALVPKKRQPPEINEERLAEWLRSGKLVLRLEGQPRSSAGLLGLVGGMASRALLQGAPALISYMLEKQRGPQ